MTPVTMSRFVCRSRAALLVAGAVLLLPHAAAATEPPATDAHQVIVRIERAPPKPVRIDPPVLPERDLSAELRAPLRLPLPVEPPLAAELHPPVEAPSTTASVPAAGVAPAIAASDPALRLDETAVRSAIETARRAAGLPPSVTDRFLAVYAARDFRPIFLEVAPAGAFAPVAGVATIRSVLESADADGLDPRRLLAGFPAGNEVRVGAAGAPAFEVGIAFGAYLYALDARGGRLNPERVSSLLTPTLDLPGIAEAILPLEGRDAPTIRSHLEGFQPPHAGYKALRAELARLRAGQPARPVEEPAPGVSSGTVRLAHAGAGLPATRSDAKEGGGREAKLIANMERWRWLPRDLGATHIVVNVADYDLRMMKDGREIHRTRVIVGKPQTQTPIFSDEMAFLVVNPSWYVPPSILRKEFLPKLASDPGYAQRRGFQVVRGKGGAVSIRQPPGDRNALGYVKFMFPNKHSVYLHDTPTRHLFQKEARAFSHGCVRVQNPFDLAERILDLQGGDVNSKQLRAMVGRGERTVKLREKLPIHLTYFTLFVDANGQMEERPDFYGHDQRLRRALSL